MALAASDWSVTRSNGNIRYIGDDHGGGSPSYPKDLTAIKQLFLRMGAIYTHRWTSCFPNEDAMKVGIAEWADGLKILSDRQIRYGIQRLRDSANEWPPTLPGFIRIYCNLPTLETVTNRLLTDGDLIDPVLLMIARSNPRKLITGMALDKAKRVIRETYDDAYAEALKQVAGLECNFVPPARIEHTAPEVKDRVSPGYARKKFAEVLN